MRSIGMRMTPLLLTLCAAGCSSRDLAIAIAPEAFPTPAPISESARETALLIYTETGPVTLCQRRVSDMRELLTGYYALRKKVRSGRAEATAGSTGR